MLAPRTVERIADYARTDLGLRVIVSPGAVLLQHDDHGPVLRENCHDARAVPGWQWVPEVVSATDDDAAYSAARWLHCRWCMKNNRMDLLGPPLGRAAKVKAAA